MFFLKLGGSLITDKTKPEAVRSNVLAWLAREIVDARAKLPDLRLLLGHGSGSFGHVAAAKYGTRAGVATAEGWRGFAEVSDAAARLNRIVTQELLGAGVPALSLQPSASAICHAGQIQSLHTAAITSALHAGLVPLIYGDVAFDTAWGGTIISTEEIMSFVAAELKPDWFLLAGETDGVLDEEGKVVPLITQANFSTIAPALGGSRGTDVTGGMASKVRAMLDLAAAYPTLSIRIFSGLTADNICRAIVCPEEEMGTVIRA